MFREGWNNKTVGAKADMPSRMELLFNHEALGVEVCCRLVIGL